jgi:hypothetical protein
MSLFPIQLSTSLSLLLERVEVPTLAAGTLLRGVAHVSFSQSQSTKVTIAFAQPNSAGSRRR